jgi:hypothetical protein
MVPQDKGKSVCESQHNSCPEAKMNRLKYINSIKGYTCRKRVPELSLDENCIPFQ